MLSKVVDTAEAIAQCVIPTVRGRDNGRTAGSYPVTWNPSVNPTTGLVHVAVRSPSISRSISTLASRTKARRFQTQSNCVRRAGFCAAFPFRSMEALSLAPARF